MNVYRVALIALSTAIISACGETPSPPPAGNKAAQAAPTESAAAEITKRADAGNAALEAVGYSSGLKSGYQLTPASLVVPSDLPFKTQVERHAEVLDNLRKVLGDSQARKKVASENRSAPGMFDQYLAAEEDEKNTLHFLAPYAIAQGKAQARKDEGYKLTKVGGEGEWKGEACNPGGQCGDVDPLVALMMMLMDAVSSEFKKDQPFGPNNDLTVAFIAISAFIDRPLGGPNSDLVAIREALLAHDQDGEIAKLIRDPIKRPIEIVQEVRDKVIPKDDTGEVAKAIRDPIKCTVGHLWGGCN